LNYLNTRQSYPKIEMDVQYFNVVIGTMTEFNARVFSGVN
jgi:hypothetical protein